MYNKNNMLKKFNKRDVKNFKNVTAEGFDFMGHIWKKAYKSNGKPDEGISQFGLWNTYTDGNIYKRLYKNTLVDADEKKFALMLFN